MNSFMQRAIDLAVHNAGTGKGGPFGALVVRSGQLIAEAVNTVTSDSDPTAHAEVNAIRSACAKLQSFELTGCDLYTSCEPCPMCFGAIYWARLDRVFYAGTRADAAAAGFDDELLYKELEQNPALRRVPMIAVEHSDATAPFRAWLDCNARRPY